MSELFYGDSGLNINPGIQGIFSTVLIPYLVGTIFRLKSKFWSTVNSINIFLFLLVLMNSGSRTAIISLMLALSIFLFINIYSKNSIVAPKIRGYWKIVVVSLSLIIILFSFVYLYEKNPTSVVGRLLIYRVSLNIIFDHPFMGVGIGNFKKVYNLYQSDYFENKSFEFIDLLAKDTYYAFNDFLQYAVETGLIIFSLTIVAILFLSKKLILKIKNCNCQFLNGTVCAILALLVCSQFSYPLHIISIQVIFIFLISIIISRTLKVVSISYQNIAVRTSILIFCLFCSLILLLDRCRTLKAEYYWKKASLLAVKGYFTEAQKFYAKCKPELIENPVFLQNYGTEMAIHGDFENALITLKDASSYFSNSDLAMYTAFCYDFINEKQLAENQYMLAMYMVPSSFVKKGELLRFYIAKKENAKAIKLAEIITRQPVKIWSNDIGKIQKYAMLVLTKLKN
ncbi:O-antigen ligase [Pedobacter sp. Leaf41]|uniref:O-antigen ligase family protein n=1 Tax=Pedobacter sp. Leaf41 TaxID=1736218 RepID=UPI00138F339C|nr:O-antigen ligase family protein [Pedobacter sp. Leaf41]